MTSRLPKPESLPRSFFSRNTPKVARDLLGKKLVRETKDRLFTGEIVETEAYLGEEDPPSHASGGMTERSKIMWEKAGLCYVYLIYGIHHMLNVTTEPEGTPGAVLIRALRPLRGREYIKKKENSAEEGKLTDGPGKLTKALKIGIEENYSDLTEGDSLWMAGGTSYESEEVETSTRIGVKEENPAELRYFLRGESLPSA